MTARPLTHVPLTKAVEMVGTYKAAPYREVLAGKLVTTTDADGVKLVDLTELARLFPDIKLELDELKILRLMEEVRRRIDVSRQDPAKQKKIEKDLGTGKK